MMCHHHRHLLLVLASSLLVVASGVEIVGTSPSQVLVKQGSSLDLYCDSSTPYQVRDYRTVVMAWTLAPA